MFCGAIEDLYLAFEIELRKVNDDSMVVPEINSCENKALPSAQKSSCFGADTPVIPDI